MAGLSRQATRKALPRRRWITASVFAPEFEEQRMLEHVDAYIQGDTTLQWLDVYRCAHVGDVPGRSLLCEMAREVAL